jgi:AcrR family transcriptional regulator
VNSLEPKQERSRKTLQKLLEATVTVLDKHGLEGATIPRIAHAARVSPASVYRRFPDKDALVEAALLNVLEASSRSTAESFDPAKFSRIPIRKAVQRILSAILSQNRSHPKLVTALKRFTEGSAALQESSKDIMTSNFTAVVAALASCPDVIRVRDKEKRIKFALLTAATAIEIMVLEQASMWNVVWSESDEKVLARHVDMFLAYLNC